jgi:NAD(P)-dependent dehydrogenase (short-subunit alcohol dehydrogenase family)
VLSHMVNNAGIGGAQAQTGEYPFEAWKKVIDVNLTGVSRRVGPLPSGRTSDRRGSQS